MRKLKKLSLNRETVRSLDEPILQQVAGANSAQFTNCSACSVHTYCGGKCYQAPYSYYTDCDSCGIGCSAE